MHASINTNDTIAAAVEGLMINAYLIDAEAAATACPTTVDLLAANRAQLLATARGLEARLDDGGAFNAQLWETSALREYVERELLRGV
ncbi:MAG: hypothetical protein EOP81_02210 [Variovorax sp.]|nr:MAG: hypothetical protein EOP81_02210 [Variovorax sp.]